MIDRYEAKYVFYFEICAIKYGKKCTNKMTCDDVARARDGQPGTYLSMSE